MSFYEEFLRLKISTGQVNDRRWRAMTPQFDLSGLGRTRELAVSDLLYKIGEHLALESRKQPQDVQP